ncbi:MAG: lycopene beta-cyclase CrtY [Filomicrobium sp.]
MADFDVIFAGGGLSTGLSALALRRAKPHLRLAIIEKGPKLGGNHTWSFHGSDVSSANLKDLLPMVRGQWSAQDVRFPNLKRTLQTPYYSIVSDDFDRQIGDSISQGVLLNQAIQNVDAGSVTLQGGQVLTAPCVIDGRGWSKGHGEHLALAYQKFFGLEVELNEPHRLDRPIIMEATVPQTDGYRFFYCLPFSDTGLLIEDTYYSETMELDHEQASADIYRFAEDRGWSISTILREEAGCLPIVLAGDANAFEGKAEGAATCGLRAGLFHPTTGYSLPDAVRLANVVSSIDNLTTQAVRRATTRLCFRLWEDRKFYRLLNRLLFVAARGDEKRQIMERFYRFPQALIERFYAGQSTTVDKFRVLSGKPPIAVSEAAQALSSRSAWQFVSYEKTAVATHASSEGDSQVGDDISRQSR